MRTIKINNNPGSRRDAGDAVLDAAASVDTKPIAKRLSAFTKDHKAFITADDQAKAATDKLDKALAVIGQKDATLDKCVDEVASAAAGSGLPRANPFKPLGHPSPSDLKATPQEKEPEAVRKLTADLRKHPGATKQLLDSCTKAEKAASEVDAAFKPIESLEKAQAAAITRRNVVARSWEKSLAALKNGARAADDEGDFGLFEALFQATAKPKKSKPVAAKKSRKKGPKDPPEDPTKNK